MEKTHEADSINCIESLTHEEEEEQIQLTASICSSNISTVLTEATANVAVSIEATALPAINTITSGSPVNIVGMDTILTDVTFTKD